MILELLKYTKSVFKNFDQSEASIVVMWLQKGTYIMSLMNNFWEKIFKKF